jgi:uncharacterized protein with HEPN domain
MVKRSVLLRLHDIREAIAGIAENVAGVEFEAYRKAWRIRRATERGIEIISEASRHIPDSLKARHAHIPWQEIAAIGNVMRHEYARVEDKIIWRVTQKYLPDLASAIEAMIREVEKQPLR